MPFGAVEAVCRMAATYPLELIRAGRIPERHAWLRTHEHVEGPHVWVIGETVRLPRPVGCSGAQGIWTLPPAIAKAVADQVHCVRPDLIGELS